MELYGHPFSSYTWKALIALYEKQIDFDFRILGPDYLENNQPFAALAPFGKFPVLVNGDHVVPEATIIIEHLDLAISGVPMIPADSNDATAVRMFDRLFDNYVMTPMQAFVVNAMRPPERRDPVLLVEAAASLDGSYAWLDRHLTSRRWAAAADFTLVDCAGAPSLFYADWVHPIPDTLTALKAYRARVLARPSVARCVEEARPYRGLFPLGAPDRD